MVEGESDISVAGTSHRVTAGQLINSPRAGPMP